METELNYSSYYRELPELLEKTYPDLNFKNHCYLRIALDNAIGTKWDLRVPKPAYKNLSSAQRQLVIEYLAHYLKDKSMLESHNLISMAYRGKLV